jgi:hypothetical protein
MLAATAITIMCLNANDELSRSYACACDCIHHVFRRHVRHLSYTEHNAG